MQMLDGQDLRLMVLNFSMRMQHHKFLVKEEGLLEISVWVSLMHYDYTSAMLIFWQILVGENILLGST